MFWIIAIEQNENGSHNNQTWNDKTTIPEGYACFKEELEPANELENFPFGDITVEMIEEVPTVTGWSPLPVPEPEPYVDPTEAAMTSLKNDMTDAINSI